MTCLILTSLFLLIPNSTSALDRPLEAIPLKEGSNCSLACLGMYDQHSDELQACVKHCQEEVKTKGSYPLEFPPISKQQKNPDDLSNRM